MAVQALLVLSSLVVTAGLRFLQWKSYLRYLERASTRGRAELEAAARAAAAYPLRRRDSSGGSR